MRLGQPRTNQKAKMGPHSLLLPRLKRRAESYPEISSPSPGQLGSPASERPNQWGHCLCCRCVPLGVGHESAFSVVCWTVSSGPAGGSILSGHWEGILIKRVRRSEPGGASHRQPDVSPCGLTGGRGGRVGESLTASKAFKKGHHLNWVLRCK